MQHDSYNFKDKDPIIDVMRTLVETYASIENIKFSRALTQIEEESKFLIKAGTLRNWFYGSVRWPQYRHIARLYLFLRRYVRQPVQIGDRKAYPALAVAARARGE